MKGLSKFLGRGLLVLALGTCFVACGDDDDGSGSDAGPDGGGTGGTSGSSGKGGSSGSSAGKGGSSGDGSVVMPMCEDAAEEASKVVTTSDDCIECLCDMKPSATAACTGDCWKLAYCVAASGCGTSDTTCIQAACVSVIGNMTKYSAAAVLALATPFTACAAECFVPGTDGGTTDAGR